VCAGGTAACGSLGPKRNRHPAEGACPQACGQRTGSAPPQVFAPVGALEIIMNDNIEKSAEEAAAFQKIWLETMSRMLQGAFTFAPNSPPPEVMRQIRGSILQALAGSWDEFMRSPQFLDGMRQWMEQAVTFRKMSNDFMAKVRTEMQEPSRGDIDSIMLTVRHIEKRLLDRMEDLSAQVNELNQRLAGPKAAKPASRPATAKGRTRGPEIGRAHV
jgi:hypothetical protein